MLQRIIALLIICTITTSDMCCESNTDSNIQMIPVTNWKQVTKFAGTMVVYYQYPEDPLEYPLKEYYDKKIHAGYISVKSLLWYNPYSEERHCGYLMNRLLRADSTRFFCDLTKNRLSRVTMYMRRANENELALIREALQANVAEFDIEETPLEELQAALR